MSVLELVQEKTAAYVEAEQQVGIAWARIAKFGYTVLNLPNSPEPSAIVAEMRKIDEGLTITHPYDGKPYKAYVKRN